MEKDINLLAAGACRNAVLAATEAFTAESSITVETTFVKAPVMRETVGAQGHGFDAVVGAEAVVESFRKKGLLRAEPMERLGAIASSVVVREGTPHPGISTVDAFCETIRNARAVIYTIASSGIYIEKLMPDLGLEDDIAGAPNGRRQAQR